jgi:hypothetical protein
MHNISNIYLLSETFFDYRICIDYSFETGKHRAISRNVEKLDEARLIHDYEDYYYAARRQHFERDHPGSAASVIVNNDNKPVLSPT